MELYDRILTKNLDLVRSCVKLHVLNPMNDSVDDIRWEKVDSLRNKLAKDNTVQACIFTQIRSAIDKKEYAAASDLQKQMNRLMNDLEKCYSDYRRNILQ